MVFSIISNFMIPPYLYLGFTKHQISDE
jgi:hypothetical protein